MRKAIISPLQPFYNCEELYQEFWDDGYRYTVLVVDAADPTDILDMVDFKTLKAARKYAVEVHNEQSNS